MPANPNGRAAEPPGGRNFSYAFGDARVYIEAPERFLEDGQMWFVTAGLFGRDDKIELHPELLDC
jgi:hypothetical protein